MTAPTEDLIGWLTMQGERHRPNADKFTEAAQALRSLQAEVERLTRTLGEIVDECPATCETSPAHSMADIARSALNTGSGEG